MGRGLDGFNPAALYELRKRRGLTQGQLADAAGLLHTHVSGLERGRHLPSVQTVHALAAALGVSPEALLTALPANLLVRLRLLGGMTQRQAADAAGLPVSSYALLERADAAVPSAIVAAVTAAVPRGSRPRTIKP